MSAAANSCVTRLLEAVAERFRADTDARDPDRRIAAEIRVEASQRFQRAIGAAGTNGYERPQRLVAAIDKRRAAE